MRTGSMSMIGRSPSMAAVSVHAGRGGGRLERAHHVRDQQLGVGRLAVKRERPGLGQRERAQVVDQPGQDARLVEHDREMRRVRRIDAVDDRLEVALDDRQRRPQLVADLGQQGPPLAFVRLEPGGHRVEAATSWRTGRRPRGSAVPRGPCSRRPRPARVASTSSSSVAAGDRNAAPDRDQDGDDHDQRDERRAAAPRCETTNADRRHERAGDEQEDEPEDAAEAAARPRRASRQRPVTGPRRVAGRPPVAAARPAGA